jgi:hypothetical protein
MKKSFKGDEENFDSKNQLPPLHQDPENKFDILETFEQL